MFLWWEQVTWPSLWSGGRRAWTGSYCLWTKTLVYYTWNSASNLVNIHVNLSFLKMVIELKYQYGNVHISYLTVLDDFDRLNTFAWSAPRWTQEQEQSFRSSSRPLRFACHLLPIKRNYYSAVYQHNLILIIFCILYKGTHTYSH